MAVPLPTTWCARAFLKVESTRARVTLAAHSPVPMRESTISTVSLAGDLAVLTRISPESTLVWHLFLIGSRRFLAVSNCIDLTGIVLLWRHDGVIKWKPFPRYWSFVSGIHRSPVESPHKGQWHGALVLSLICIWTSGWANNRDLDDLKCHGTHYDVAVMYFWIWLSSSILKRQKLLKFAPKEDKNINIAHSWYHGCW